jgi:hypothetical protein
MREEMRAEREERRAEFQAMREEMRAEREEMRADFKAVRGEIKDLGTRQERDDRLLLGLIVTAVLGMAGMMAKGFHWF